MARFFRLLPRAGVNGAATARRKAWASMARLTALLTENGKPKTHFRRPQTTPRRFWIGNTDNGQKDGGEKAALVSGVSSVALFAADGRGPACLSPGSDRVYLCAFVCALGLACTAALDWPGKLWGVVPKPRQFAGSEKYPAFFAVYSLGVGTVGLGLALLLNCRGLRGKNFFRTVFIRRS